MDVDYEQPSFLVGRLFSQSTEGPITKQLAKFPKVADNTQMVLDHFSRVDITIRQLLNSGKVPGPDDPVRPCNHKNHVFGESAANGALSRGWPKPPHTCITDVMGTDLNQTNPSPYTEDDLYNALYSTGKILDAHRRSIANSAIDNFTNPDFPWNYELETPSQKCTLNPALAYRIGDTWVMGFQFTNEARTAQLPNFGRQTLNEFPYLLDGKLAGPFPMCLPVRPKNGTVQVIRNDSTTMLASFRGTRNPSFIARLFIEDNPAVLRAIDQTDLFVQQAEDALTPSNIAILVLPLVLNLIPIALLANVDTLSMLLYTVMSDVLTVIPLGIKGLELVIIGLQRQRSVFVRMTGEVNGSRPEIVAAELHAAECRAHDDVLPAGIAFLVLSLIFLVGGVAAEFIARAYTAKKRKYYLEELEMAESSLSSRGSFETPSWPWKEALLPRPAPQAKSQSTEVVGSPFRANSFSMHYDQRHGRKKA